MINKKISLVITVIMIATQSIPVLSEETVEVDGATVAMVSHPFSDTNDKYVYYGAREFASAWNIEVTYNTPDIDSINELETENPIEEAQTETISGSGGEEETAVQIQEIYNQIKDPSVDALCVSAVQSDKVNNKLKNIMNMGIPVITWGSDADPASRNIMVAPDSSKNMGEMLVQLGVDCLNQQDVKAESAAVKYCWLSSSQETDEEVEWKKAGDKYILEKYPNWEKASDDGEKTITDLSDVDVILCTDQEILIDQLEVMDKKNLTRDDITVTGFGVPSKIKKYCSDELIYEWGYWDLQLEGAVACYVAAYLGMGNVVRTGETISIPYLGDYRIYENGVIDENFGTGKVNSGVILLDETIVLTEENADKFCF